MNDRNAYGCSILLIMMFILLFLGIGACSEYSNSSNDNNNSYNSYDNGKATLDKAQKQLETEIEQEDKYGDDYSDKH